MVPSVSECPFRVFPSATPTPDTESTGGSISLNRLRTKGYKQCGAGFSLRRASARLKTGISDQESPQLLDAAGFKLRIRGPLILLARLGFSWHGHYPNPIKGETASDSAVCAVGQRILARREDLHHKFSVPGNHGLMSSDSHRALPFAQIREKRKIDTGEAVSFPDSDSGGLRFADFYFLAAAGKRIGRAEDGRSGCHAFSVVTDKAHHAGLLALNVQLHQVRSAYPWLELGRIDACPGPAQGAICQRHDNQDRDGTDNPCGTEFSAHSEAPLQYLPEPLSTSPAGCSTRDASLAPAG